MFGVATAEFDQWFNFTFAEFFHEQFSKGIKQRARFIDMDWMDVGARPLHTFTSGHHPRQTSPQGRHGLVL
jgi:hypothetical protein